MQIYSESAHFSYKPVECFFDAFFTLGTLTHAPRLCCKNERNGRLYKSPLRDKSCLPTAMTSKSPFKWRHFLPEIILWCVRALLQLSHQLPQFGGNDGRSRGRSGPQHALERWVHKYAPELELALPNGQSQSPTEGDPPAALSHRP